jgi:hypothetical protein
VTYGEQVRHPGGAFSNRDETLKGFWRLLCFAAVIAAAIYFAWRMGWMNATAPTPKSMPARAKRSPWESTYRPDAV